jgi:hypothetical protein
MRDKDQVILENAYSEIKTIKENLDANNVFVAEVDVDIFKQTHDISLNDHQLKTKVYYKIELEYRSWGLKDIYLHVIKVEPFTVEWEWDEEFNEGEKPEALRFEIDSSEVQVEHAEIKIPIYPQTLEIWLDKNNKIIQSETKLVF